MTLSLSHLNIRSLVAHLNDFRVIYENSDFDFIALSETWLNNNIVDSVIALKGYKIFRTDRGGRGGGVALYVTNKYLCHSVNTIETNFEQLWVAFTVSNKRFIVGVLYKPPSYPDSEFIAELEDVFNDICPKYDYIICTGDFNIDISCLERNNTRLLIHLLESYELQQLIDEPTRYTSNSTSIIDLIICSKELDVFNKQVSVDAVIADHNLISCKFKTQTALTKPKVYSYRDLKNIDVEKFGIDLSRTTWPIFDVGDIDAKVAIVEDTIINLFNIHAPLKTIKITKKRLHGERM
nr:unnamed protein product [Callosobruchus analis]